MVGRAYSESSDAEHFVKLILRPFEYAGVELDIRTWRDFGGCRKLPQVPFLVVRNLRKLYCSQYGSNPLSTLCNGTVSRTPCQNQSVDSTKLLTCRRAGFVQCTSSVRLHFVQPRQSFVYDLRWRLSCPPIWPSRVGDVPFQVKSCRKTGWGALPA